MPKEQDLEEKIPKKRSKEWQALKTEAVLYAMEHEEQSLSQACRKVGIYPSNFLKWCDNDENTRERYARARKILAEVMAENICRIADSPMLWVDVEGSDEQGNPITTKKLIPVDVNRAKLMVDARKWQLSKILPKEYGDHKIEVSANLEVNDKSDNKSSFNVSLLSKEALAEIMAAKDASDREQSS